MPFSRRRFLSAIGAGLFSLLWYRPLRASASPAVIIHRFDPLQTSAPDAIRAALLDATDLRWLRAGESVFIKVASNSYFAPPAVTSPAALTGVIQTLREHGADTIYVGDMSGAYYVRHLAARTTGSTRESMRINGLLQTAEDAGATIHCFEEVPFENAYIPGIPSGAHHWGADLQVAEILDRVDHIINLPRLGKHVLAGASLGLKNAVGWISDHSRMVLHRDAESFHQKIAEINAIPQLRDKMRATLTLVDQALTTQGPDQGYRLKLDTPLIIASEDVVNHDQIALRVLLWGRERTPAAEVTNDAYFTRADAYNKGFVQMVWQENAQTLPVFEALEAVTAQTYLNLAYEVLYGGRPAEIRVRTRGLPLDERLIAILSASADSSGIVLESG